jgi:hypothetical protein
MNYDRAIAPLKPDRRAAFDLECRAVSRALAAQALSYRDNTSPAEILKAVWPNDDRAARVLKGPVSPTALGTSGLPLIDVVGEWRSITPSAAIWKLLSHDAVLKISLRGIHQVSVPYFASLSAPPVFVAEGAPAPAFNENYVKVALGPVKKILALTALSEELQEASPQDVSAIISNVLSNAVSRVIDVIAFDANAATAVRPAGLLNGLVATTAASGTSKWENVQNDLANLIGAIGDANVDPSDAIFVTHPFNAALISARGADLDNDVLMSIGVPRGTVICLSPVGLAAGLEGVPTVEVSKEATWQAADTNPQDIVGTGGAVAPGPVVSAYQKRVFAIRVRGRVAFAAAPGAVSFIQSANW